MSPTCLVLFQIVFSFQFNTLTFCEVHIVCWIEFHNAVFFAGGFWNSDSVFLCSITVSCTSTTCHFYLCNAIISKPNFFGRCWMINLWKYCYFYLLDVASECFTMWKDLGSNFPALARTSFSICWLISFVRAWNITKFNNIYNRNFHTKRIICNYFSCCQCITIWLIVKMYE